MKISFEKGFHAEFVNWKKEKRNWMNCLSEWYLTPCSSQQQHPRIILSFMEFAISFIDFVHLSRTTWVFAHTYLCVIVIFLFNKIRLWAVWLFLSLLCAQEWPILSLLIYVNSCNSKKKKSTATASLFLTRICDSCFIL